MQRRTMARMAALGASLSVGMAGALSTAPAGAAPASAPATGVSVPSNLTPVRTLHSLTGTHSWYAQTFKGLPVIDGYWAEHVSSALGTTVDDGRLAVPATLSVSPSVQPTVAAATGARAVSAAGAMARSAARPKSGSSTVVTASGAPRLAVYVAGGSAHLVWQVRTTSGSGVNQAMVDARTGVTLATRQVSKDASGTGTGQVFYPNPVVTLRNENLKDRGNANNPALKPAYKTVQLTHLDGSGRLSGDYANVFEAKGGLATSATGSFVYTRKDLRFEQVNAYYGITQAQEHLQAMGFTDANNEPQDLSIDTTTVDNSFYDPSVDTITYGTGGVDDAEDQEVVWHEYGHAIQDAIVPGFGSTEEAGAIGEGFGDYWAVSMSIPVSNGFDLPCVMDWDSTSYTAGPRHCLRRLDTGKTTDDVDGEVHDDGEIWSNALWSINRALGRDKADRIVIESTYLYSPDTTFAAAARNVVATARAMYGASAAASVRQAFVDRKIL